MSDCASCDTCGPLPWRIDLVRYHGVSWKHWWACSETCAQAFVVTCVVTYAERLELDGFTYTVTGPTR